MTLRALIIDDEIPACTELSYLLGNIERIDVVGCAHDGTSAFSEIIRLSPDVIFLDIKMPGMNAFDLARKTMHLPKPPHIVFATAYDEYTLEAFDVRAVDYILKPIEQERLEETVLRIRARRSSDSNFRDLGQVVDQLRSLAPPRGFVRVSVIDRGKILFLQPEDVLFCEASEGSVAVVTKERFFNAPATLNELERRLLNENFFRVHRSFLVNLKHVREIVPVINGTYQITMDDDRSSEIPVSRRRVGDLREILSF
ncbi:MAG: response regulator transcription factor [Deltaproteobacteria bacterium]|nr:response regulator transcription factor [Deltaproteobacteria bacterium]